ncbi:hypothetical protein BDQ12DRAFT_190495 [Crucibulum laeve]|uniref:Uncharacterized protein n=1 Tax=Crucibulum laeve TaxID=68775 RepID=A0A5C3MFG9_9AGAR|nr:hypothetical protein BDQ12DRAFT_190495 [Crucibulum laeve]
MPRKLKELEDRNAQLQRENVKLFEDNRNLASALQSQNDRLNLVSQPDLARINQITELQEQFRVLKKENELLQCTAGMSKTPGYLNYDQLLAEYQRVLQAYNAAVNECNRMQIFVETLLSQRQTQALTGLQVPPPRPSSTHKQHPKSVLAVPSQHPTVAYHTQRPPFPTSVPTSAPKQPRPELGLIQTQQAYVMQMQRHASGRAIPPSSPQVATPQIATRSMLAPSTVQTHSRSGGTSLPNVAQHIQSNGATPMPRNVQQATIRPLGWPGHVPSQDQVSISHMSPFVRRVSQPSPSVSTTPVTTPGHSPRQRLPLTPIGAVSGIAENSVFANQQSSPRAGAPSKESPARFLPTPPMSSLPISRSLRNFSHSQSPPSQPQPLQAPSNPLIPPSSSGDIQMPDMISSPSASRKSNSLSMEVATPADECVPSAIVVETSPVIGTESVKRSSTEMLDGSSMDECRKRARLSDVVEQNDEAAAGTENGAVDEEDEEDEEEIVLGPDGLRLVNDCLELLFEEDAENEEIKTCQLCQARYVQKVLLDPPKPYVSASEDELVQHCLEEHEEVWNSLRKNEPIGGSD